MTRRRDRHRRLSRRNYVGEKASTTKLQLVMACGLLAMLLALGPTLSDGAAGCFQAVSGTVDEAPARHEKHQLPTTRVKIHPEQDAADVSNITDISTEKDAGGQASGLDTKEKALKARPSDE